MKIQNLILTIAIITSASAAAFPQANRISNIQWTLTHANGKAAANYRAYFEIDSDQSKFTGNAGCNRMFGGVMVRNNRVTFSNVATTKMMCKLPDGSVPERSFLNAMEKAATYAQFVNTLFLYDRNRRTLLRFKRLVKQAPEDPVVSGTKLESRKWMLESIKNRRTFAAIKGVFINFDREKQSAGGNAGCNVFGGSYSSSKSAIRITEIISTMRACTEGDKMDLEREFLDGLRSANRYEMKAGRLFLYNGRRLLLTLRGEAKN